MEIINDLIGFDVWKSAEQEMGKIQTHTHTRA